MPVFPLQVSVEGLTVKDVGILKEKVFGVMEEELVKKRSEVD